MEILVEWRNLVGPTCGCAFVLEVKGVTAEIKKSMEIELIRIRNFFMKLSTPWGILLTFFLCLFFFLLYYAALGMKRLASEELVHQWDNKRLNIGQVHI